jgi:hypothetical protein
MTKFILCTYDYSDAGFEHFFKKLDLLHDFASAGRLAELTPLRASEVIGWLEDIIFTAEETIREIDARALPSHIFAETYARDAERPAA